MTPPPAAATGAGAPRKFANSRSDGKMCGFTQRVQPNHPTTDGDPEVRAELGSDPCPANGHTFATFTLTFQSMTSPIAPCNLSIPGQNLPNGGVLAPGCMTTARDVSHNRNGSIQRAFHIEIPSLASPFTLHVEASDPEHAVVGEVTITPGVNCP